MKPLLQFRRFKLYGWIGLGYLLLATLSNLAHPRQEFWGRFLDDAWRLPYATILHYIFFEYTLPRLKWNKFTRSALLIIIHLFLYSEGLFLWRELGVAISVYTPFPAGSHEVAPQMEYSMASLVCFSIIRHIYNHIRLRQAAQQLLIEKQQAELNYLKSQTNPHFLFNTLNNIYSLARDKSDRAPETILRLSKILRYMLYEAGGPYIAIGQELKIIEDYISLEKLRYDDSLIINFNYNIEDLKQALPPLLLMPLVENAFKHGASETRHHPFVDIHLSVERRQLTFLVRNSTEPSSGQGQTTFSRHGQAPSSGQGHSPSSGQGQSQGPSQIKENIGLSNLKRQLELLYTDYELLLEQRDAEFAATLKINLASHV